MQPNYRDRRRFLLASLLTVLALPALWWANRSVDSAAPNVAVAGVDVGVDVGGEHDEVAVHAAAAGSLAATADPAAVPAAEVAPATPATTPPGARPGDIAPVFFDGPNETVGAGRPHVAVPTAPPVAHLLTTATYRSTTNRCLVPGMLGGNTVTIVNVANGRSATCTTAATNGTLGDTVTLPTNLFNQIADLTDAPIHVELRR